MPFKSEKIKLPETLDRRRKLTDKQKEIIKQKYETGLYSLNDLATLYGVSKKTILIIVNPESKKKNDDRIKKHWRDYSPEKEERNSIMREHRRYKQDLFESGKIGT